MQGCDDQTRPHHSDNWAPDLLEFGEVGRNKKGATQV